MVVGGVRGANNAVCGAYVRPDLAPNTPVSNPKSYVMTCFFCYFGSLIGFGGLGQIEVSEEKFRVVHTILAVKTLSEEKFRGFHTFYHNIPSSREKTVRRTISELR